MKNQIDYAAIAAEFGTKFNLPADALVDERILKQFIEMQKHVSDRKVLSALNDANQPLGANPSTESVARHAALAPVTKLPHVKAAIGKTGKIGAGCFMYWEYDANGNPTYASGLAMLTKDFRYTSDSKEDAAKPHKKGDIRDSYVGEGKSYATREAAEAAVIVVEGVEYLKVKVQARRFAFDIKDAKGKVLIHVDEMRYKWEDLLASLMGEYLPAIKAHTAACKDARSKAAAERKVEKAKDAKLVEKWTKEFKAQCKKEGKVPTDEQIDAYVKAQRLALIYAA